MLTDGYVDKIYYRYFKAENPKACIFAIHGLGGHCLWFDRAAKIFNKNSISFFSYDQIGFGQSHYEKGKVNSYKDWIISAKDTLQKFMAMYLINVPIFLVGHSMGTLIAILLSEKINSKGIIMSVPGFEGDKKSFPSDLVFKIISKAMFSPDEIIVVPFGPEVLTKNKTTQQIMKRDPYRVINQCASLYFQVHLLTTAAKNKCKSLTQPVLLLKAGEDVVCSNGAMDKVFNTIKSTDKTKKEYKNLYHDLFVEDEIDDIAKEVSDWINKHL